MDFKKSRNLMWICFAIGILIIAFGFGSESVGFAIMGTAVFFAGLVQAFIFYRCPYCGYSLMNVRGEVPDHCPKCGKSLKQPKIADLADEN